LLSNNRRLIAALVRVRQTAAAVQGELTVDLPVLPPGRETGTLKHGAVSLIRASERTWMIRRYDTRTYAWHDRVLTP